MRVTLCGHNAGKTVNTIRKAINTNSINTENANATKRSANFYNKLSRTMAYALRHNPQGCGLQPDETGRVPVGNLLEFLNSVRPNRKITKIDIIDTIKTIKEKRFELKDDKIRAYYGHSFAQTIQREPKTPPKLLFHGTSHDAAESIMTEGLTHQKRQFVHLSTDIDTATKKGKRKDKNPVMILIDTIKAKNCGVNFYPGNDFVWMSDDIPPTCLRIINKH